MTDGDDERGFEERERLRVTLKKDKLNINSKTTYSNLTENDKLYIAKFMKERELPINRSVKVVLPKVDSITDIPKIGKMVYDGQTKFLDVPLDTLYLFVDYIIFPLAQEDVIARNNARTVLSMYPCVFKDAVITSLYGYLPNNFNIKSFLTHHVLIYVYLDKENNSFFIGKGAGRKEINFMFDGEDMPRNARLTENDEKAVHNDELIEHVSDFLQAKLAKVGFIVKFNGSMEYYYRVKDHALIWSVRRRN
tara:strand:- start:350 stop:1099 length:750 start_codon:yes stop_codon:yes gene_type:complete